jgi:hypothetical protein
LAAAKAGQIGTIRSAIKRVERRCATMTREIGKTTDRLVDRPLVFLVEMTGRLIEKEDPRPAIERAFRRRTRTP